MKLSGIIVLVILTLSLSSCKSQLRKQLTGNNPDSERSPVPELKDRDDVLSTLAFLSGKMNVAKVKERTALMSFKHELPKDKIQRVLNGYFSEHRTFKTNADYDRTITTLSEKYELPKERVASLVMDYQSWLSCGG